jgi:hypothetical protein
MTTFAETPAPLPVTQNQPTTDPLALAFLLLFAASEIIGSSNIKANGVIQLILKLINSFKPVRKEDEVVSNLHQDIQDLTETVQELRDAVKPAKRGFW